MARRISALFSSKDEDLTRSQSATYSDAGFTPPQTPSRGRLTKPMSKSPSDLSLAHRMPLDLEPPPVFTNAGISSGPLSREGRSPMGSDTGGSRHSSSSRPQTPTMLAIPTAASPMQNQSPSSGRLNKRRSWLPGKTEKHAAGPEAERPPCQAWIAGLREIVPYDLTKLFSGQQVDDLWDDTGDVVVYLYPQGSGKGPSFRVNSQLFADSRVLSYLVQPPNEDGHDQTHYQPHYQPEHQLAALSLQDEFGGLLRSSPDNRPIPHYSRPLYSTEERDVKSVYLPLGLEGDFTTPGTIPTGDDMELVVLYRNFFAFLCGGALVATLRQNSLYAIFMSISSILRRLQYGNEKGSSWGAVPWASFSRYTEELRLADVRSSREKNIEAILLGVAMKSWPLYAEGFSHAAGRLDDIKTINSPKYDRIMPGIVNKLERAHYDLQNNRLLPLHVKLDNFYFPSMFAGIANSQTATEAKLVRFKAWKAYFMDFRQFTMTQYKKRYGNWPPKAKSKKNNFEESGLNRQLIREVYQDFTDLYEMLVDRTSLTTRTADMPTIADDADIGSNETIQHALRSVESEYDRSTPPVTPPIPFDVPLIPAFGKLMLAREAQTAKKLKDNELHDLLLGSYNRDSIKHTPWISDFLEHEQKLCHGKTIQELTDVRCGQWLFSYAVLQALPMTAVDARDLKYTDGVEHFLCEAPRGGRPWMQTDDSTSRAWFNVASGGGLVSMPADTIDHSVEGIYRRSHCWTIANKWAEALGPMSPVQPTFNMAHVAPPAIHSPYLAPQNGSAAPSPYHSPYHSPLLKPVTSIGNDSVPSLPKVSSRTSMNYGLEEVAAPTNPVRPISTYNPNVTFDNILASQGLQQKSGKKGKK